MFKIYIRTLIALFITFWALTAWEPNCVLPLATGQFAAT